MRRIRHLVWFDALALAVPLAAWAVFLLVEGTLFYFGPAETASLPDVGSVSATLGLAIVRMVATAVIIALLVHADPTVGTTAFWRSRPIPRLALLVSKLISALLWLVVLPGIVTTIVLLLLGMDLAAASEGGSIVSCDQTVFVFAALALAIVTKDLVQFIVAAAIGIGLLSAFNEPLLPAALSMWPTLANLLYYLPRVAVATVVIGLAGLVTIYQYLTLRVRHSIAMLACALILASVAPLLGARVSVRASTWPEPAPTGLIGPSDVVLSVVPGTQLDRQTSRGLNNKLTLMHELSFEVVTSGEPDAVRFTPVEVRSDLECQGHSVATWTRSYPWFSSPASGTRTRVTAVDQPYRSIRQALGNPELVIPPSFTRTARRLAVFETTDEQFLRCRGQSARLDANVTGLAYRYREAAATPLKAGSRMLIPNTGVMSVESASRTATGIMVVLRETRLEHYGDWWGVGDGRSFVLRNATRRLVLYGAWAQRFRSDSYTRGFAASNVVSTFSELSFSVPDAAAGGPVVDDEWMKSAELVRVDSKVLGTVTRPLRIDNLVIGGEPQK
jgi:hypothetical protein